MLELKKEFFDEEAGYKEYSIEILTDGEKIGRADVIVPPEEESDEVYLEWIEIYEDHRNNGFGSEAIKMLAEDFGFIYFAPCDEDNVRCYERIADLYETNAPEVDQGFGVYYIG